MAIGNEMHDVPDVDLLEVSAFCNELADGCREISLRYFRHSIAIDIKDDSSPVTVADRSIEEFMRARIAGRFPDHAIVGEEMERRPGKRYAWYIDPIDGTKSFISGMPLFGTLVGLHDEPAGRLVFGMIDMPALSERWIGEGTTCSFNGKPTRTSKCRSLETAQLYTSSPDIFSPDDWEAFEAVSRRTLYRRFGGDCYLYGLLASGHCDLVMETSLKTFDFMALVPVVEGAGGIVRDWDGKPLTPKSDGRVIAAATEDLLVQSLEILQGKTSETA